jgi:hypothetical protein
MGSTWPWASSAGPGNGEGVGNGVVWEIFGGEKWGRTGEVWRSRIFRWKLMVFNGFLKGYSNKDDGIKPNIIVMFSPAYDYFIPWSKEV